MAGNRNIRLEKVEHTLKPSPVIIVNWNDEEFTCEGRELTREEYETMCSLPGANVLVVHFVDVEVAGKWQETDAPEKSPAE